MTADPKGGPELTPAQAARVERRRKALIAARDRRNGQRQGQTGNQQGSTLADSEIFVDRDEAAGYSMEAGSLTINGEQSKGDE